MDLLTVLGEEIGVRQAGTSEARRAADAVADALRELGLAPRFEEFHLLGYEAEEPELEIDGERWDAGPCVYAHPTDGAVEGRVRQIASAAASCPAGSSATSSRSSPASAPRPSSSRRTSTPSGGGPA